MAKPVSGLGRCKRCRKYVEGYLDGNIYVGMPVPCFVMCKKCIPLLETGLKALFDQWERTKKTV